MMNFPANYIWKLPRRLPKDGSVIVHNRVHAQWGDQMPGWDGFRVWTTRLPKRRSKTKTTPEPCDCGWSGLPHYRSNLPIEKGGYSKPPSVKGVLMPDDVRAECEDLEQSENAAYLG
jgi:hypothetical protein